MKKQFYNKRIKTFALSGLCIALLYSCSSTYKNLQPATASSNCLDQFKPAFSRTLYQAQVDVLKHHFSGILLIKLMPDSSYRLLFTTETGVKFFDFEFSRPEILKCITSWINWIKKQ